MNFTDDSCQAQSFAWWQEENAFSCFQAEATVIITIEAIYLKTEYNVNMQMS